MRRNDLCWCGSGAKWKKCHYPEKPVSTGKTSLAEKYYKQFNILLKTPEQVAGIRHACEVTAGILDRLCAKADVGITTNELDAYAADLHKEAGVIAAPLGYGSPPFPKSICTSLNDEICHGIPNDIPLQDGDILNIDVSCIVDGYFGDCSRMVMIGTPSPEAKHIVDVSYECLMRSIAILKPGICLSAVGDTIEDYAQSKGCSVVNQFVGHGLGLHFHEAPQVQHHRNQTRIPLAPGMTFTIEPMINAGVRQGTLDDNQWTARTVDGKLSAQWEHSLLITDDGVEILTPWTR